MKLLLEDKLLKVEIQESGIFYNILVNLFVNLALCMKFREGQLVLVLSSETKKKRRFYTLHSVS